MAAGDSPMSTNTPNYNFILPAVNSSTDEDLWGDELNTNFSSLDTVLSGTIGSIVIQKFETSDTYTPTANMLQCVIKAVGGGGSGGGGGGAPSSCGLGGGGSGGTYAEILYNASDIGASQVITIGAGGAVAMAGSHPGNPGDATSVGALISCPGGFGGNGSGGSIAAGVATAPTSPGSAATIAGGTTILNVAGGFGGAALRFSGSNGQSGCGGSSTFGAGGGSFAAIGSGVNNAGFSGVGYGSGSSGGITTNGSNVASLAGNNGVVIIIEFIRTAA